MRKNLLYFLGLIFSISVSAQCVDNGNYWNESWVSCQTSQNPNSIRGNTHWILYEFHENHNIDSTYIWNANRAGESGWGAKDVVIDYSEDGNTWIELGSYTFPQANESANYSGFLGPIFNGVSVNKILITILSTHDNSLCASIAEVQFRVDCLNTWYQDADNDGLGNDLVMLEQCEQPVGYVSNSDDRCDNGALGWEDALTIFDDSGCTNCHNTNATSGLNLTTYASFLNGGNQCSDLASGTILTDIITNGFTCSGGYVAPMNGSSYAAGAVDADELATLQAWIDGGAPEFCEDYCFNGACTANIQLKFFLEGPYDPILGEMVTDLNSANLIPLNQPYNVAPFNYNGGESVASYPSPSIVDWVFIQARDINNWDTVIESRACFVLKDGTLMDIDGSTGVNFYTLDENTRYRFAVYHKSHLGILSASDMDIPTSGVYDFTNSSAMTEGISQTTLVGSIYALHAGDYDNNGIINNQDFNLWTTNAAVVNQYVHWDGDCNTVANNQDFNLWNVNKSKVGETSIYLP